MGVGVLFMVHRDSDGGGRGSSSWGELDRGKGVAPFWQNAGLQVLDSFKGCNASTIHSVKL